MALFRDVIPILVLMAILAACNASERAQPRGDGGGPVAASGSHATSSGAQTPPVIEATSAVRPELWQPADEGFRGCEGG
jgi:hypothetical protein